MKGLLIFFPLMSLIKNPQSLLITAPHHLGDWVAKVPFIRLFKSRFPDCKIFVMGRKYIEPLVQLFSEVDAFIDFEFFFNRSEEVILKDLKNLNVDVCLHLLGVQRQVGPRVLEYAQKANIPYRLGNKLGSKWRAFRKNEKEMTHNLRCERILPHLHEFEWNLLALQFFGLRPFHEPLDWQKLLHLEIEKKEFSFLKKDQMNLLIHPGSLGNAKEWPLPCYQELIERWSKKAHVILTGTKQEQQRQPLKEVQKLALDLRGQLDLLSFIQLIASADGLVAGSTGPIHLASLFKTPICALFPKQADISARVWGPKSPLAQVISAQEICMPCQRKLTELNKELCTCMEGIDVDKVDIAIATMAQR